MNDVYERFEHAGVIVEIVSDDEPFVNPMDNDNAGRILSWNRDFSGDEVIHDPDGYEVACNHCDGYGVKIDPELDAEIDCPTCEGTGEVQSGDIARYFQETYGAALTIPLWFSDYGSSGARIYESDDPNCVLIFTEEEIAREWPIPTSAPEDRPESMREYVGGIDAARSYAQARISELDHYMQGYVFGIVIRERTDEEIAPEDDSAGEVLDSVYGIIGEPDDEYIRSEARAMAEAAAQEIEAERAEVFAWACRDVETVR